MNLTTESIQHGAMCFTARESVPCAPATLLLDGIRSQR